MGQTVDGIFLTNYAPFWEVTGCICKAIDRVVSERRQSFLGSLSELNKRHNFCNPHLTPNTRMVSVDFRLDGAARCLSVHFNNKDYQHLVPGEKLLLTLDDNEQGQALMFLIVPQLADLLQVPTWIYSERQDKMVWQAHQGHSEPVTEIKVHDVR